MKELKRWNIVVETSGTVSSVLELCLGLLVLVRNCSLLLFDDLIILNKILKALFEKGGVFMFMFMFMFIDECCKGR